MFAAFVAAAATLVLVAWLVVSAGSALMLADARIDASLREDHVQSMLSSTIDATSHGDERSGLTQSVHQLLAEVGRRTSLTSPSRG